MKVVGLIAEYDPFHNGHLYHIQKAKELTGADHAVVVMSGDFVQRGTPAFLPKRLRAEMALRCGAGAVFELPVFYASGSAELFAEGAVSLLAGLGIVDAVCFGSECGDLSSLERLAAILAEEPDGYRTHLKKALKQGLSFPAARQEALSAYLEEDGVFAFPTQPNDILGIEYLKALRKSKSPIQPCTIRRVGSGYHDTDPGSFCSSASAIRKQIEGSETSLCPGGISPELKTQVPPCCFEILRGAYHTVYPIRANDFSLLLKYRLLRGSASRLEKYLDVNADLANRICRSLNDYADFEQFCKLLKTKELTYTRVSRALTHILLDIRKKDVQKLKDNGYHFYAKLLGFRRDSREILTAVKRNSSLKLLARSADRKDLCKAGRSMLKKDVFASNLYGSAVTDRYKTAFSDEFEKQIVKV